MPVTVSSPSRLHFGLFAVGDQVEREFGGIGLMVKSPRTTIVATAANTFSIVDQSADSHQADRCSTVHRYAKKWRSQYGRILQTTMGIETNSVDQLPIKLSILEACPRHNGLGSGTQLAITTALTLQRFFELPSAKPHELAIATGRAGRSAIGTYGIFEGGFLVDRGKNQSELVAPIDLRIDFPEHWPIALVFPQRQPQTETRCAGLHGADEVTAFQRITPTTSTQLNQMRKITKEQIVPAIIAQDYSTFSNALQRFGRRSGDYFKSVQGGTFASPQIKHIIETIHKAGLPAVGQTSWGPCVFAIAHNQSMLKSATQSVQHEFGKSVVIQLTQADNQGALISVTH